MKSFGAKDHAEDIVQEVYNTHTLVLKRFKASELCQQLQDKLIALSEKKVVPKWILGWCLETSKEGEVNGSNIHKYYYDNNNTEKIKNYCEEDVKCTINLIKKLKKL